MRLKCDNKATKEMLDAKKAYDIAWKRYNLFLSSSSGKDGEIEEARKEFNRLQEILWEKETACRMASQ